MHSNAVHSKRIAKNSLLLSVRLVVTMIISLYTFRIVLGALGLVDNGIYSVVAGVVIMIAFLNNSLTITTQRFLNYEMGRNGKQNLSEVFSTAVISHYAIAVIIAILAETIGLWYVTTRMDIPPDRLGAAIIVFHSSVVTLVVKIIGSPYNAAIIANEKMRAYAYISLLETVLNLLMALLLTMLPYDKLAAYGILMMTVSIIVRFTYIRYCRLTFPEYRFKFAFNKRLFVKMFSFAGWMIAGTFTGVLNTQGVNVLMFTYFGPLLVTARATAIKVQGMVQSFIDSFFTAVQPQIVKSYSAGDMAFTNRLVFTSSKLSFFIVMLIALPLLLNTELIFNLWLREVPEYAVLFTQLLLIDMLIISAYLPIGTISQASGRVRAYQLIISASFVLIFLLTWWSYSLGKPVYYTYIISIVVNFLALFARLFEVRWSAGFSVSNYLRKVFAPEIAVLIASFGVAFGVTRLLGDSNIWIITLSAAIYLSVAAAFIYLFGLDRTEKEFSRKMLLGAINKIYR